MTQAADLILTQALTLSAEERARIAEQLIRSLDGPVPDAEQQTSIDQAWSSEIGRRIKDVEEGRVQLLDGDQIMYRLRPGGGREA